MNVTISGFYDEISGRLDKQIAVIKKLSQSYLCPRVIDGKNIADYTAEEFEQKIKPRLDKEGIKFSSIGSPIGKVAIDDEAGFEKQVKQLKELVKIAKMMNCEYIRVFSFFYGNKKPDSVFDTVVKKMRIFLDVAQGSGVKLMHENEKKIYGDVPERVLKLYHELNSPDLALCYDASNFIQCGVDPVEAFEQLKEYVEYYHIKDCGKYGVEVPVGTGEGNYKYIIGELKKRNYSGFMTLEPHTFKYSIMKLPIYILPFGFLLLKNYFKTFREIDKAMGVCPLKAIGREQVFEWQFNNLEKIIRDSKEVING